MKKRVFGTKDDSKFWYDKPIQIAPPKRLRVFAVTGTFHGSIVECYTEGDARRAFHKFWNGESILQVKDISHYNLDNL